MKLNKALFLFLFVFLIAACSDAESANGSSTEAKALQLGDTTAKEKPLVIGSFSEFPPEVEGCSCYYSTDSVAFAKREYLYVDDNDETAYLKVNGELLRFKQVNFTKKGETNWEESYQHKDLKLSLKVGELKQNGDETWLYTGTLEVTDGKQTVIKTFYGECGC